MLYEFAIEPAVLAGWDKCRNVLNLMGFRHGRAIAAYPTQRLWKRMVLEACRNVGCKEKELLRITEKLASDVVGNKFLYSVRGYDDTLNPEGERWFNNALNQQGTANPFHAILARQNPALNPDVVLEADVDEAHPKLNVSRETTVLREADALAIHIRSLVRNSNSLVLVDPHFEPWLGRWWNVIKACLCEARDSGRRLDRVEIHALDTDKKFGFAEFERRCNRNAVAFVPKSLSGVRIVRWRIRAGFPDDFHERYVLTDRGGYKLGKGLDEEVGKTQPVALLDDLEWQRVWALFQDIATAYDRDGELRLP